MATIPKEAPWGAKSEAEASSGDPSGYISYLEQRLQYLEEVNRFTLDALEMASSLGDFQPSINKLHEVPVILRETRARIKRLLKLQAAAFFLVNEETNEFDLFDMDPPKLRSRIQAEVERLIQGGTFAWTLREKRPIIVPAGTGGAQLLLHVMSTSSRVRGMFVGLLEGDTADVPDISLSLLSIILLNSSNALESFELYRMIREISEGLESRENYRTLFEAAPDGVEVLDARGTVIDCNQTHLSLLGRRRRDIIGSHATEFFTARFTETFRQRFTELQDKGYVESEVELLKGDGSCLPVWRREKAIHDEEGRFVGSVVYNRDLSEFKEAEAERSRLEARLQRAQKMEALGTLAGGVAHDLNNILGGLVSYPELLLTQIPADSPLRRPIETIRKSGERAAAIVQDLLTLGRRGVVLTEVVNLNDIVNDYFNSAEFEKVRSFHPGVEFSVDLDESLMNTMGSPVHLSKVVMNLVSNAAEAIPEGGVVRVTTENRYLERPVRGYDHVEKGDYAVLSVADTGCGIMPDDMERIFEPFYTKKVLGRSGTGLGMAVVWGTVKDHRGYIDVRSEPSRGTTFRLYFPVTLEGRKKGAESPGRDTYRGNGETILVVDDVETQRHLAVQILSSLGYRVPAVKSGEGAVAYLESNQADLVVLDMIMDPGIDGLETFRRIKALNPGQRAIIASGFSGTDRVKEAQELGVGSYVKKPYTIEKIGSAVRAELDR